MQALPPGASIEKEFYKRLFVTVLHYSAKITRSWARMLNDGKMQSAPYLVFFGIYGICLLCRFMWPENITKITAMFAVFGALAIGYMWLDGKITPIEKQCCISIGSSMVWVAAAMSRGLDIMVFLSGLMLSTLIGVIYWRWLALYKKPNKHFITAEQVEEKVAKGEFDDVKWMQPDGGWENSRSVTNYGWKQRLDLPTGTSAIDFIAKRQGGMASVLGVGHDDIELVRVAGRNDMVDVFCVTKGDYLATPSYWPPLREGRLPSVWDPIPTGLRKTGDTIYLSLVEKHLLIAGESGSGKSNELSKIAAVVAHDPTAQLWCLDGKRLELLAFRHAAKGYCQDNIDHAVAMLKAVQAEMNFRYDEMGRMGIRKAHDSKGVFGPIVVMFDELARYLREGAQETNAQKEFISLIFDLGERGRAAGVSLVTSVIRPSAKLFNGGDLRALFIQRMALRMADSRGSQMVLGEGQPDASQIDQEQRGMFYLFEGQNARIGRGFYVPDEHLAQLAASAPACDDQWGVLMADEAAGELVVAHAKAAVEGKSSIESRGSISPYRSLEAPKVIGPTFPDGSPIREEWHVKLWEALSATEFKRASEFEAVVGKTRNPVIVVLRRWTEAGYLEPTVLNSTTMWRKKVSVDA